MRMITFISRNPVAGKLFQMFNDSLCSCEHRYLQNRLNHDCENKVFVKIQIFLNVVKKKLNCSDCNQRK